MTIHKVLVSGSEGRMGQEVTNLVLEERDLKLAARVDREKPEGVKNLNEVSADTVDVAVDFSSPELLLDLLKWSAKNNRPVVSGTTGFQGKQWSQVKKAAEKVPVFWAPNMSLGVAVVSRMLKHFSALKSFDYQVEEIHHNKKKDQPSGTGIYLQEELKKNVGKGLPEPVSIRGGGIYGIHKIWAMSDEEMIAVEHTALNRQVFARGSLKAAKWLVSLGPGLYSMESMLVSLSRESFLE